MKIPNPVTGAELQVTRLYRSPAGKARSDGRKRLEGQFRSQCPEVVHRGFLKQAIGFSYLDCLVARIQCASRRGSRSYSDRSSGRKSKNRDCQQPASPSPRPEPLPAQAPTHHRIVHRGLPLASSTSSVLELGNVESPGSAEGRSYACSAARIAIASATHRGDSPRKVSPAASTSPGPLARSYATPVPGLEHLFGRL